MNCRWFVLSLALVGASACTVDISPPEKGLHLRVLHDIIRTDTIDAEPSAIMVVEVSESGRRLSQDMTVRIAGISSPDNGLGMEMLPLDTSRTVMGTVTVQTSGEVSFFVKFGRREGRAGLVVSVDALQFADTLWFEVLPGAPAHIRLKPGDTTIVVGGGFTQDALIIDRGGNELNLRPVFASSDPALTVSPTGAVQGTSAARAGVSVTYAAQTVTLRETAMVSVVPYGRIAQGIATGGTSVTSAIAIRRSDGLVIKSFPTNLAPFQSGWSPDGLRIYFTGTDPGTATYRLFALNVGDGSVVPIVPSSVSPLSGQFLDWPASSQDGSWLYFSANKPGTGISIWRIHPDGSGAEQLVASAGPGPGPSSPSPSPDGTRVAYVLGNDVKILTIATATTNTIHGTGADEVRWAPSGERLATRGGAGLYVVNSDGSGMTQIASNNSLPRGLDWSPDGRWILVTIGSVPTIVDPASGLMLPTPLYGAGLSWSN